MQVMVPTSSMDFDFASARSSPHVSPPASPKRFGHYFFSAPTSPSHMSEFYTEFDSLYGQNNEYTIGSLSSSSIPFGWEEKPGTPKSSKLASFEEESYDFAFCVSQESDRASLSAEELFDGGKIKPLKPPPRVEIDEFTNPKSPLISKSNPMSPISHGKKIIGEVFSPRRKKESSEKTGQNRGRDRTPATLSSSNSGRRTARSHSPYRISHRIWEEEEHHPQQQAIKHPSSSNSKATLSSNSSSKGSKRWSLKDLFLFRSASEGRATDKDPLRKYSAIYRKSEEVKNSSSSSKRRGPVSAHEKHYIKNKAAAEDMKKKTFLPYKQGILGRLSFNPAVHALANGFGSFTR